MVLALIEQERGSLIPVCQQTFTAARTLAKSLNVPLNAVAIGPEFPGEVYRYGVSRVYRIEHPSLLDYAPEAWAKSVAQLMSTLQPQAVVASSTDRGNEILARVGAMAGVPLAANCIQFDPGPPFRVVRFRWGGSLLEEANLHGAPKLLTIAPYVIEAREAESASEGDAETFTPTLEPRDSRVRVTLREEIESEGTNLRTAAVVVGGGRGVGSTDGFRILEELATLFGGAVGGSRVATNNGWRPHSDQIGLTGNRIAPDLYIACGISGAIQHLVGCKGAKRVMVINKDREAPFFRRADYGVVGDLHEILPALIREIRHRRSSSAI